MAGDNSSSEVCITDHNLLTEGTVIGASLSEVHATTAFAGKVVEDPMGLHVTVNFKTQEYLDRQRHVTCHGYVKSSRLLGF
ncbi:hypothetical protein E4U24_004503 [Claviceps purpurea]|nr:hypothetical protein E4U12_005436 [Claviceps purpurea]KAG6128299.1 hypothetical protein E4U38_005791 [Claviceps purpurea]KAG6136355.1 hypothetical protein E4U28_005055 [Claviceps purpurea]KAG6162751.1 hypothetical protein E4U51_006170 [Claviceps purpurea]KAG6176713.1 hypothetical protein E4U27_004910 [Claviceps purpurea]